MKKKILWLKDTHVNMDPQDWHEKFADRFTDDIVATDTSYSSPDLSIQLTYDHYDTGVLTRRAGEGISSMGWKCLMYSRIYMWGT